MYRLLFAAVVTLGASTCHGQLVSRYCPLVATYHAPPTRYVSAPYYGPTTSYYVPSARTRLAPTTTYYAPSASPATCYPPVQYSNVVVPKSPSSLPQYYDPSPTRQPVMQRREGGGSKSGWTLYDTNPGVIAVHDNRRVYLLNEDTSSWQELESLPK